MEIDTTNSVDLTQLKSPNTFAISTIPITDQKLQKSLAFSNAGWQSLRQVNPAANSRS